MSPSNRLTEFVQMAAQLRGIPLKTEWIPEVALHLQRLLDAAQLLEESEMASSDIAPRFEP